MDDCVSSSQIVIGAFEFRRVRVLRLELFLLGIKPPMNESLNIHDRTKKRHAFENTITLVTEKSVYISLAWLPSLGDAGAIRS